MSLAEARVKLQALKQLRLRGVCPATQLKQEKVNSRVAKTVEIENEKITVRDVVEIYLKNVIEDRVVIDQRTGAEKVISSSRLPKGQDEARRTLYSDAVRILGDRPAIEVTRKKVVEMTRQIIDRGAYVQAGRVLSELSSAFEYAIGLDYFPDYFANPALQAKASLKQSRIKLTPNKRMRVLDDNELRRVFNWLPVSGFSKHHKNILRLTLFTGYRTGEICGAEWADFD